MKKLQILCVVAMAFLFASCEDTSGKYAKKLLTKTQIELAFSDCLELSTEYAVGNLCPANSFDQSLGYGFSTYKDGKYRIEWPTELSDMALVLIELGKGDLLDSLEVHVNRVAETCGDDIVSACGAARNSISYANPQALLSSSSSDALTEYFETNMKSEIAESLLSPVRVKLTSAYVMAEWDQLVGYYYDATQQHVYFNLPQYVTNEMMEGIYSEMAEYEGLVRGFEEYRLTDDLYVVFGNR